MNSIWAQGRFHMERLLRGLTVEQLEKAKEVAEFLLLNTQSQRVVTHTAIK
jgi:hypothetical protein